MTTTRKKFVFLGLSITSSWGNGHATTYRSLLRGLIARRHDVLFLERDKPWYADNRDLDGSGYGRVQLYSSLDDLNKVYRQEVAKADVVIVGSYVPDGIGVCNWVLNTAEGTTAFYDIDTPVTLAALDAGGCEYLSAAQIPRFDVYLSFTGGPTLRRIKRQFGARDARVLYCSVDPRNYYPSTLPKMWDLGYLGTYSADRQPALDELLLKPAAQFPRGRFHVAGPMYPSSIAWPENVERADHLAPSSHNDYYNSQRFTLNITREHMKHAGYSPSVRLFEAASCGTPIISDKWDGIEDIFEPGLEILLAESSADVTGYLKEMSEADRAALGIRARERVLRSHTGLERAMQLESYISELSEHTLVISSSPAQTLR